MMKKRIKQHTKVLLTAFGVVVIALCSFRLTQTGAGPLQIKKGAHIVLIGNNLGSRMMNFGHFETEMQLRHFPQLHQTHQNAEQEYLDHVPGLRECQPAGHPRGTRRRFSP